MDFPAGPVAPATISTGGMFAPLPAGIHTINITGPGSYDWPLANLAVFVPMRVPCPYPVRKVFWANGATPSSNMDMGIYTPGGARIYSTGSTAQSGASNVQVVTPTLFVLSPGLYYFALANDGATALTARGYGNKDAVTANQGKNMGLLEMASAFPLPATATFATWTRTAYPLFGISQLSLI